MVGAQRVDRDEQHIGAFRWGGRRRRRIPPTPWSRRNDRQQEGKPDDDSHGCREYRGIDDLLTAGREPHLKHALCREGPAMRRSASDALEKLEDRPAWRVKL